MSVDDVEAVIAGFIRDRFMIGKPSESLSPGDSLLDKGILDSTGVLELVGFLEERFAMRVEDDEMVPENLESVRNIVGFLRRKIG